ncbi:SIR2 family protein [Neorhizobium sp. T786]|uniref:SIR2 family protein n=1 Tax=Pseudorhizobium xiangyangii TaxID=2883104 RepID=UPI001CFFA441|nr:SIR2 family protein [Neorhizobium xiangyangii]MCB5203908.1 SIR2 family protein [Neorhizobium xiangyangii]
MFADNTVFIVGAGASAEFNLPVGSALMDTIKQNSNFRIEYDLREGVRAIYDELRERYRDGNDLRQRFESMAEINRSIDLAGSIDEFINRHYDDPIIAETGKLQIAYAIAKAEHGSLLARNKNSRDPFLWDNVNGTWIKTFTQLLFEGVRNDDVEQVGNNITIIVFNYDRCIEHYLTEAIIKTFRGIDRQKARQIVDQINIIHPYGSLGRLDVHPFGDEVASHRLRAMSESIVTWSESVVSETAQQIEEAMLSASTLVFLGFAFAPQNMDLLAPDRMRHSSMEPMEIYATGYGYDDVIDRRLKRRIINLYSMQSDITNEESVHIQYEMKCAKFIQSHSMALVK